MREFVYFSQSARTSGNFDTNDLMKAGRMDIAIHSFIQGVFLSHSFRKDMKFHFIFIKVWLSIFYAGLPKITNFLLVEEKHRAGYR